MKFINEYKKYFIKGLVVFFLVVTINFAYGFSEIDNSYTEESKQYDELILNDEELLDVYTEEENLLLEEIEYQDEIKKVLTTYLVEDESGAKYFEISEDEYDKLNSDMQNIIDESVKIYSEYLLGNYILSQNGEFEHKDNSEIIELQSADFTVITKKVWGIPYGFELRFAPGPWSYIASTIAIVGGSVNLLWDILSFDPNVITRLAYTFTGALQTILLDLVTYITKLPSFIVKSSVTLLRRVKNNPFISGSLNVIMTVLKFVFPPMVHGLAAFKAVQQNKSVSYHYNTIFYSKTTVNGKVI